MSDRFENVNGLADPARKAFAVTPHASNEIDPLPKAIFIGTGGNIVGRAIGDETDTTFKNCANGQVLPVRFQYIRASGTTAADIVGLA